MENGPSQSRGMKKERVQWEKSLGSKGMELQSSLVN